MARRKKKQDAGKASTFPVVGVGASAGGLPAILTLFKLVPKDSGLAFVLVTHLKPDSPSHMAEILASKCALPVVEAVEGIRVEPDHVYVIPPNRYITLHEGCLRLAEPEEPQAFRRPIDLFLQSLAHNMGRRAICIVLSGTGADGSAGLRTVKAEGGFAIAQSPESAEFEGMPRAAIATGVVDLVLPPRDMPAALARFAAHPYVKTEDPPQGDERQLNALLSTLYSRTHHDFRAYKKNTLLRRIYRRMGIAEKGTFGEYADLVRQNPEESTALVRDLMISVSGFFRDPEAWVELENKVIAPLVDERADGEPIRVWVPGCATGEEAYSIGMLLLERAEAAQKNFEIKIFATDTGDDVLRFARNGVYPASIAANMPQRKLERFFVEQDDTFRVGKGLRDVVIFAPQNVLQDPPFTRLDLVSCRNLLIYLENDVQRRLMSIFHFAVHDGGHLFLGPAESLNGEEQLFSPLSKKWRIFRRLPGGHIDSAPFPLLSEESSRMSSPWPVPGQQPRRNLPELAREALLDAYAPAAVVIDRQFHILYFHGDTSPYLHQPPGEPSNDLLAMARGGLRAKLRGLVHAMSESGQPASILVQLRRNEGKSNSISVTASSLRGRRDLDGLVLVAFAEQPESPPGEQARALPEAEGGDSAALESELNILREELRGTVEQMETSHEELKASHEEIMSMNEELQSTNEELETSKEELQSLNEELSTVNSQLQAKLDEIESHTDDMTNLLASSNIATLFLDVDMRIRWFTPALSRLMELLPTDIGRPVAHFSHHFTERDLLADAQKVLRTLTPGSAEVRDDSGRWYLRETMPFRTEDNRIDGVVITFIDVSRLKEGERELREQKKFADNIIDAVRLPVVVLNPDATIRLANRAFREMAEVPAERAVNRSIYEVGGHRWDIPQIRRLLNELVPKSSTSESTEVEIEHAGSPRIMRLSACRMNGPLILLAIDDLTDDRARERQQQMLSEELNHRVKNSLLTVQALANQTLKTSNSLASFGEKFKGRLHALAAGHDLVMRHRWQDTALQEIAQSVLKPFMAPGDKQVSLQCEGVKLKPQQALSWALLLHELTTNAAKYGALSLPTGRVSITIERQGKGEARLKWNETGGPRVHVPGERGFGTELILRIAQHDLSGHADLQFRPEGLLCSVTFPESGDDP